MIHGRGGSAQDILSLAGYFNVANFAILAPQARNSAWYPLPFLAPPAKNEPGLSSALQLFKDIVEDIKSQGISEENIYFLGFSQGACLSLEFAARNATRYGGIVALTGGLIGDKLYTQNYSGDLAGTPVFIASSDPDPFVPIERVYATTTILKSMNAVVTEKIYPGMGHTINQDEIEQANKLIFSQ